MSRGLYLDASGWYAALSPRDRHHATAAAAYQRWLSGHERFLTTDLVVTEVHALLVRTAGPDGGVRFLDRLRDDPAHEIVWATPDLQLTAVDRWLRPYRDVAFSLTDAVSFEVMRREGLDQAFTFDRHFLAAGFRMMP